MRTSFRDVTRRRLASPLPLVRYLLLTTETHALCGALAFFAMLGFYPLSLQLFVLAKDVLRSPAALEVVQLALQSYYPVGQEFLLRNLEASSWRLGEGIPLHGALWILLGGAGVFIPLETAFNRLWGFAEHRSYWRNQCLGLVLTLACWGLAVTFVLALASLPQLLRLLLLYPLGVAYAAVAIFLFYRFLPHGPVASRAALPAAAFTALAGEVVRWIFVLVLPLLDLPKIQGPFHVSVTFLVFVYVEAFVLLAGAYLAAEATREPASAPSSHKREASCPPPPGATPP